ncbi:hypothetical protein BDZ91DRAFT_152069 [Kalaharituber pfeilii]|nr:hypothetical protein BDZ91DRAFT_152069 [Kalaharituber pfeilii]
MPRRLNSGGPLFRLPSNLMRMSGCQLIIVLVAGMAIGVLYIPRGVPQTFSVGRRHSSAHCAEPQANGHVVVNAGGGVREGGGGGLTRAHSHRDVVLYAVIYDGQ